MGSLGRGLQGGHRVVRRWLSRAACALVVLTSLSLPSGTAFANDQTVLMRMLESGSSFRVRARAAVALGRTGDATVVGALERGLADRHAAVRAAAATALGQVGTRRSVAALRVAASDRSPRVAEQAKIALRMIAHRDAVRRGEVAQPKPAIVATPVLQRLEGARYAVVVGDVRNRSTVQDAQLSGLLKERMLYELDRLPYVAVFRLAEMDSGLLAAIRRRKMHLFRVEGNLTTMQTALTHSDHSVRAEVSLLLLDEPERVLRSMMRGAATGMEQPRGPRVAQRNVLSRKAITGAVRSAMANAPQAIEAAAIKRDLGMSSDIRAEASLSHPLRKRALGH